MLRIIADARTEAAGVGDVAGRDNLFVFFFFVGGGKKIASELLANEFVVREIAVESVDDPVAIAIHLRDRKIGIVAGGVGVANDIEPVAAPTFAISGRGEKAVDDFFEGVRRFVV